MNKMNDQIIEWKNPDGKITKLNFDDDGNLIGTKSKEDTTKPINKRYRYYEDLYGNEYRWNTHRQEDGKFKAWIVKAVKRKTIWISKTTKSRSFTKRKSAIAWCLKAYLKAKERQRKVLDDRSKRKQTRLDLKPKFTSKEKAFHHAQDKRKHYEMLQKNLNKKIAKQIKTLKTRIRTYQNKVNYYKKREVVLK